MGRVAKRWGQCPSCDAALTVPVCSNCGWSVQAILDEYLRDTERVSKDPHPSIRDPELAAQHLAQQGMGASFLLLTLGAIDQDDWISWNKRLMDAAGIPWQNVDRRSAFTLTGEVVEGESPESEEP